MPEDVRARTFCRRHRWVSRRGAEEADNYWGRAGSEGMLTKTFSVDKLTMLAPSRNSFSSWMNRPLASILKALGQS